MIDQGRVDALRAFVVDERGPVSVLDDLLAERQEMLALLREAGDGDCCPFCFHAWGKHAPDCRLGAFLRP